MKESLTPGTSPLKQRLLVQKKKKLRQVKGGDQIMTPINPAQTTYKIPYSKDHDSLEKFKRSTLPRPSQLKKIDEVFTMEQIQKSIHENAQMTAKNQLPELPNRRSSQGFTKGPRRQTRQKSMESMYPKPLM